MARRLLSMPRPGTQGVDEDAADSEESFLRAAFSGAERQRRNRTQRHSGRAGANSLEPQGCGAACSRSAIGPVVQNSAISDEPACQLFSVGNRWAMESKEMVVKVHRSVRKVNPDAPPGGCDEKSSR